MRILIIIMVLSLVSCKLNYELTIVKLPSGTSLIGVLPPHNIPEFTPGIYQMQNVTLHKDTLKIEIQYSGGCSKHEFYLYQQNLKKDTIYLNIKHKTNGDACRSLIQEKIWFDLSPLRLKNGKQRIIALQGWDSVLTYSY